MHDTTSEEWGRLLTDGDNRRLVCSLLTDSCQGADRQSVGVYNQRPAEQTSVSPARSLLPSVTSHQAVCTADSRLTKPSVTHR